MRRLFQLSCALLLIAYLSALLAGCGQKGDLYLPEDVRKERR